MFLKLFVNLSVVQPRSKHVILLNKYRVCCAQIGISFTSESEIAQVTFIRFQSTRCCWRWSSVKDLPSVIILMMKLKLMSDFGDEATYHISGKVSRYNCHIWDSETP